MTAVQPQLTTNTLPTDRQIVNDFSITVATVNGSGSQTSNLTLMRTLFKMGIPVSGKNLFPSNIQGLPTWFTIRVSKDGFLARREEQEIVVALNPQTFAKDLESVVPGGAFFYADNIKLAISIHVAKRYGPGQVTVRADRGTGCEASASVAQIDLVG